MGWDDLEDGNTSGAEGGGIPPMRWPLQVIIRDWARLGMPGDEKGKGESYEKARRRRAVKGSLWLLMANV